MRRTPQIQIYERTDQIVLIAQLEGRGSVTFTFPVAEIASDVHRRLVLTEMLRKALDEAEQPTGVLRG